MPHTRATNRIKTQIIHEGKHVFFMRLCGTPYAPSSRFTARVSQAPIHNPKRTTLRLAHAKIQPVEPAGFTNIDTMRVRMINCSMIIRTRNPSGAILDRYIIDGSLTLVDLSWTSNAMGRIIHQLFPLTDPAR